MAQQAQAGRVQQYRDGQPAVQPADGGRLAEPLRPHVRQPAELGQLGQGEGEQQIVRKAVVGQAGAQPAGGTAHDRRGTSGGQPAVDRFVDRFVAGDEAEQAEIEPGQQQFAQRDRIGQQHRHAGQEVLYQADRETDVDRAHHGRYDVLPAGAGGAGGRLTWVSCVDVLAGAMVIWVGAGKPEPVQLQPLAGRHNARTERGEDGGRVRPGGAQVGHERTMRPPDQELDVLGDTQNEREPAVYTIRKEFFTQSNLPY